MNNQDGALMSKTKSAIALRLIDVAIARHSQFATEEELERYERFSLSRSTETEEKQAA